MRPSKKRFCYFVYAILGWGTILAGCTTVPLAFTISSTTEASDPPPFGSKDYARALSAIASVMSRDFMLPVVDVSVTVYPSKASYESGVVAQVVRERERLRRQLGPGAKLLSEEEFANAGRRLAVSSDAVGNYREVIVNDSHASKYVWQEWVRLLAHELTHSAQKELINGRPSGSDQWLREGFAEWIGYKVADKFGAENFAKSRQRILDLIATARSYQTFPSLNQLASNTDWITWFRTLSYAGTYGQALIAVDVLIEEKGIEAMVDYFRRFGKLNNRERNFLTAFGETLSSFDERFSRHLGILIGRSRLGLTQ
jgi:hypothetical protein